MEAARGADRGAREDRGGDDRDDRAREEGGVDERRSEERVDGGGRSAVGQTGGAAAAGPEIVEHPGSFEDGGPAEAAPLPITLTVEQAREMQKRDQGETIVEWNRISNIK